MPILHRTFRTSRPAHEAFAYLSDYSNTAQWDPNVASAERITKGTVSEGTKYFIECKLSVSTITLEYEILEFVPDKRVVLHGKHPMVEVLDIIEIIAIDNNTTEVSFTADISFVKPLNKFAFIAKRQFKKLADTSIAGLKLALDNKFTLAESKTSIDIADKLLLPGLSLFSKLGYQLAKKQFQPFSSYIRDKHIVITGASSGLGLSTARALAAMGAQLTLVARKEEKVIAIIDDIVNESGNQQVRYAIADLSSIAETLDLVAELKKRDQPIDVLINNAGALFNPRQTTSEGLEKSFALLLLSPYVLTTGLRPLLKNASKHNEKSRVINVVSGGMYSQKLRIKHLQSHKGRYSGSVAYARNKRALMIMTELWAKQWQADGICVNAMHPGWADTPGVESALPAFHSLTKYILRSPEQGADTIVWLAAAKEATQQTGKLFLDREIHSPHLTPLTVEKPEERIDLEYFLQDFAEKFKEIA